MKEYFEFYNELGEKYPESERVYATGQGQLRKKMLGKKLLAGTGLLLDIGCNDGVYSEYAEEYVGIDPAMALLEKFKRPRIQAIAQFLPVRSKIIPRILITETLEHIPEKDEVFIECERVMTPGGEMLLTVPSGDGINRMASLRGVGRQYGIRRFSFLHSRMTHGMIKKLADNVGLEIETRSPAGRRRIFRHIRKPKEEKRMKVMVTGGSGWIGGHLVRYLQGKEYDVFNYDILEGFDITDFDQLHRIFDAFRPDHIYHLAGQAFLKPGEKDAYRDLKINGMGMINLLRCLEDYGGKMVYTSSGAVYGISPGLPHKESAKCTPHSNYGVSKLTGENYLRKWVMSTNVDARIGRFSSVYGPGRSHGPVNIFVNKAKANQALTVFGDGRQTRDLVYIDDAIMGIELVLERGGRGEIYNIGTGREYSVLEVAEIVSRDFDVPIVHVPHELSHFDQPRSWYNISKARLLGYIPRYDLEVGIMKTIEGER